MTTDIESVYEACTRILGHRPRALVPDDIVATARGVKWQPLPNWEAMGDTEVALRSGLYAMGFKGPLLVVTEASLASRVGAFDVEAQYLGALVSQHLERFGEAFFNGDVIVVERNGNRLWLFHHEGLSAEISAS